MSNEIIAVLRGVIAEIHPHAIRTSLERAVAAWEAKHIPKVTNEQFAAAASLVNEPPLPLEHSVSRGEYKMPPDMEHRLELQGREFRALDALIKTYRNLPAVVDDDYPEMRYRYDGALTTFLEACKANGRFERVR